MDSVVELRKTFFTFVE